MIEIEHLNKSFGNLNVLRDINLSFSAGNIISLIGPNGSGKTTMIKCLLGLVRPDQGDIRMNGEQILGSWHYRNYIGYMPQIGRYPDQMKIRQLFEMMKNLRGNPTDCDEELINAFGLNFQMEKRMSTLSGGTRQKVSAALAYLFHPQVLILDEPTAGLDPLASECLKKKIKKEQYNGKLTLITSHNMSEVEELADDVIYIVEGKIRFHKKVQQIHEETGESRLGSALAVLMEGGMA